MAGPTETCSALHSPSVLRAILDSGAWRLMPFLLLYSVGFATLFPIVPTIVTNGFASQAAGHYVDCEAFTPATSPPECRNAHAEAVTWTSWTSFVSGSILSFLCAPAIGRLSDHWGRKPFMLMGISTSLLPMCMLAAHLHGLAAIQWYYVMNMLGGVVSSFSMALTAVADLLPLHHRATAIGYLSASFSVGILIGPVLGAVISRQSAVYVCISMIGVTFTYVALFVHESAPRVHARKAAAAAAATGPHQGLHTDKHHQSDDDDTGMTAPLLSKDGQYKQQQQQHCACGPAGCKLCSSKGCSCCHHLAAATAVLDFDPVPNVVPHVHEHTLLPAQHAAVGVCLCSGICNCACGPSGADSPALSDSVQLDTSKQHAQGVAGSGKAGAATACALATGCSKGKDDMWAGFRILRDSLWYRKLTLIWVIVAMTWEGAQDMLMQYLQLQLGFTTKDQALLLEIVAVCGLVIKLALLPGLVKWLGEQYLLALGLTAYALQDLLLAWAPSKTFALAAMGVGSLACVSWPASVALQTSRVDPRDIGAVQGALSGISSLATGVGPLLFAALFSAVTRTDSKVYAPQVVWYVAFALSAVAIALTLTLHWGEDQPPKRAHGKEGSRDVSGSRRGRHVGVTPGEPSGAEQEGLLGSEDKQHVDDAVPVSVLVVSHTPVAVASNAG